MAKYEISAEDYKATARVMEQLVNYFAGIDQVQAALQGRPVEYSSLTIAVFNVKDRIAMIDPDYYEKVVGDID